MHLPRRVFLIGISWCYRINYNIYRHIGNLVRGSSHKYAVVKDMQCSVFIQSASTARKCGVRHEKKLSLSIHFFKPVWILYLICSMIFHTNTSFESMPRRRFMIQAFFRSCFSQQSRMVNICIRQIIIIIIYLHIIEIQSESFWSH